MERVGEVCRPLLGADMMHECEPHYAKYVFCRYHVNDRTLATLLSTKTRSYSVDAA